MVFAWVQVALSVGAAVQYAHHRDWLHALYWILAAGIVTVITLMKG